MFYFFFKKKHMHDPSLLKALLAAIYSVKLKAKVSVSNNSINVRLRLPLILPHQLWTMVLLIFLIGDDNSLY